MFQSRRFFKISKEISTLTPILIRPPILSRQQGLMSGLLPRVNALVFSQIIQLAFVSDAQVQLILLKIAGERLVVFTASIMVIVLVTVTVLRGDQTSSVNGPLSLAHNPQVKTMVEKEEKIIFNGPLGPMHLMTLCILCSAPMIVLIVFSLVYGRGTRLCCDG